MQHVLPGKSIEIKKRFASWAARGKGTVLVVDDEPAVVQICVEMIKGVGYTAETATSGREALDAVRASRRPFSLVLLDRHLPDMTLEEIVAGLRQVDENIQIIIQSGDLYEPDDPMLVQLNIGVGLQKPFSFNELTEALKTAMVG